MEACEKHEGYEKCQFCEDCKQLFCVKCEVEHFGKNPKHCTDAVSDIVVKINKMLMDHKYIDECRKITESNENELKELERGMIEHIKTLTLAFEKALKSVFEAQFVKLRDGAVEAQKSVKNASSTINDFLVSVMDAYKARRNKEVIEKYLALKSSPIVPNINKDIIDATLISISGL